MPLHPPFPEDRVVMEHLKNDLMTVAMAIERAQERLDVLDVRGAITALDEATVA